MFNILLLVFIIIANYYKYLTSGHSSVVERLVANEKVVGSSPIARSKIMIIWIASYPKSGNTYLRSFISSYYFSKKGKFDFNLLLNILQFPSIKFSNTSNENVSSSCFSTKCPRVSMQFSTVISILSFSGSFVLVSSVATLV